MWRAVVILVCCWHLSALAQFAGNAQRDAHIAALTAKVNAQTVWIRQADRVIRELLCSLTEQAASMKALADGLAATPAVHGTIQVTGTSCLEPGKDFPALAPMP
jgi:hypothetical protein